MENNALKWLEGWFKGTCDGDREHRYGVSIGTLDNPGWFLVVDLAGTPLIAKTEPLPESFARSENDWIDFFIDHDSEGSPRFSAAGGANNLLEMIQGFHDWVGKAG